MITPYTADNRLDPEAVDRMVEFYASAGCQGLFAVCQSSGMFCPFFVGHMSLKKLFSERSPQKTLEIFIKL